MSLVQTEPRTSTLQDFIAHHQGTNAENQTPPDKSSTRVTRYMFQSEFICTFYDGMIPPPVRHTRLLRTKLTQQDTNGMKHEPGGYANHGQTLGTPVSDVLHL